MTPRIFAVALAMTLFVIGAYGTSATKPFYMLDFRSASDLKMVFNSGLHPRRVHLLERTECEVANQTVELVLAGHRRLTVRAHNIRFTIQADNTISQVVVISGNYDYETAQRVSSELISALGVPLPDLQAAFDKAAREKSFEPLRNTGAVLRGVPEAHVSFIGGDFVPADPLHSHLRVVVSLYWSDRLAHGKARRESLQPPAGYESESMEPLSYDELRKDVQ